MSFLGVELPDNIGSTSTENSSNATSNTITPDTISKDSVEAAKPETIQELLDLDKHERFRWQGKEWTAKELKNSHLMHGDYTRKTQKHAEEVKEYAKYKENFHYDLEKVIDSPELLDELRGVYPKEFVLVAEKVLRTLQGREPSKGTQSQTASSQRDPRIDQLEKEVSDWKKAQHESLVEKYQSWLSSQHEQLSKKFEWANKSWVDAQADWLIENKKTEITDKILEKLYSESHAAEKAKYDKLYAKEAKQQLTTGQKTKDTARGGGIAGDAPKGPKNFKEARAAMAQHYGFKD